MPRKDLKNKPLVEAILEVRWRIPGQPAGQPAPGVEGDPHYRFLLGRFSERVQKKYPFHEPLPTASIPDVMVPYMPQHRFRVKDTGWPLLQMGPGIMTVNDTEGYTWTDFNKRCQDAVSLLLDAHPSPSEFKVQNVTLRYIDAVSFDYGANDVFQFLKDKMKITLGFPESLFEGTHVAPNPTRFSWQTSFANKEPDGTVTITFGTGLKGGSPVMMWETIIQSEGQELPDLRAGFSKWLSLAHDITDDWFFKLIDGELERRFSSE